ncbi:MAG: dockerin type I repeat-containing protein [candidate division Zixibacteria bacterium]|nr:dockerin type I repeat-containing protein [candidate division Zixibacteria bacterium]
MLRHSLLLFFLLIGLPMAAFGQLCEDGWPVINVGTPAPSSTTLPADTTTWLAGNVYHLQGFIFVPDGGVLVIQPGTIIKSDPGQGTNSTALIITRGGKIIAQGTPQLPIIFTSIDDNVCDTGDVPDIATSRGLWGGVILEGRSYACVSGGISEIEGIPDFGELTLYGGGENPDCSDNSGIMQYVSIRYPGSIIGANNEINGLTLAAVGSGTVIDHIETYLCLDDDFEWFGGSVNCSYLAAIYGDDDAFDGDECYSGTRQFLFELKDPRWGDRITEHDGRQQAVWTDTTSVGVATPATPAGWGCAYPSYALAANWTCIGQGPNFSGTDGNNMLFRENYRAYWYNSVFMEQPKKVLLIDCPGGDANIDLPPSSTHNLPSGAASIAAGFPLLDFVGNFWYHSYNAGGGGSSLSHFTSTSGATLATQRVQNDLFPGGDTTLTGKNHAGVDPLLTSYEVINPPVRHAMINPVPASGSPLIGAAATVPSYATSVYYTPVTYAGAFEPGVNISDSWIWGWTFISTANILGPSSCCDMPGDANNDGKVNVGDGVYIITYVFRGGPAPICLAEGDANGDGKINVGDAVYIITYVFRGGPAPICGPTL